MKGYFLGLVSGLVLAALPVIADMSTPDGSRNFIFQNQMRQQQREMLEQQRQMQQQLDGMKSPC